MDKKIAIIGSSGLLGKNLALFLKKKKFDIFKYRNKKRNNLTKLTSVKKILKKQKLNYVINLASITNIDNAEKYKKKCYNVNYKIVENFVKCIKQLNYKIFFIQISTDQLYACEGFSNEKNIKVLNYYGKTKLLAEKKLKGINSCILRTNFFGKSITKGRFSFTDWIYNSITKKNKIFVADDILFNPVSINTLCGAIYRVIKLKKRGIFNVSSNTAISKYKFAIYFSNLLNLDKTFVKKSNYKNIKFKVKRPKDMRMKNKKFTREFNFKFKKIRNEIQNVAKQYEI